MQSMQILVQALLVVILNSCEAVIYRLSDEEYNRMPPVFKVDDYDGCLQEAGGLYCQVQFTLVSDQPSELLDMIREYSEHYTTHFNYTQLQYGVCVSQCLYNMPSNNLGLAVETCLNNSFWQEYRLKTRLLDFSCESSDNSRRFDLSTADVCFGAICIALLILNALGSVLEYNGCNDGGYYVKWVRCFALQRNWVKLNTAPEDGLDPRLGRFKSLHGIRAINAILVVLVHGLLPVMLFIENTRYVEGFYYDIEKHILFNGTPIIQTFFILSGFLLVFKFLLYSETNVITWKIVPKIILKRSLRLLPVYGFMLALTCTWVRFMGDGPVWHLLVTEEHNDCKKQWWKNLLFINNYDDVSKCYPHTWSLACDMQLYIIGVLVCVSSKMFSRARNWILGILLVLGTVIPSVTIYYYDLDGALLVTPTIVGKLFMNDPNFDYLYKRTHTNLFNFVLGMSLGYFIYEIREKNINIKKYHKYKPLYWCLVPGILAFMLAGGMFYHDGPRLPMSVRLIYGTLCKTLFGVIITILIAGMMLKFEDLYRRILEWPRWIPLARASYSSFIMHTTFIRLYVGSSRKLNYFTYPWIISNVIIIITISFVISALLWILVEAPMKEISEILLNQKNFEINNVKPLVNGYHAEKRTEEEQGIKKKSS